MKRFVGLAAMALLVIWPLTGMAYTLWPDGSGDFPNIQTAINGCMNGDEIVLMDGIYTGAGNRDIDFMGKAITLRSFSGIAENCVIDIAGVHGNFISEQGMLFDSGEGPGTIVRDLYIINGDGDGS